MSGFCYILKVNKTRFSDEFDKDYEIKRRVNDFKAFGISS